MELCYSILDPTGNITALVENEVDLSQQQETAAKIMRRHPDVEQVGFLNPEGKKGLPTLRMAGGEFCGNASMCAAALLVLRRGWKDTILLNVSGAAHPVAVTLRKAEDGAFLTKLQMPPALEITERSFTFDNLSAKLPLVRMEGISHLVMEEASPFFSLLQDRCGAERAVRELCTELSADGFGLLFLEGKGAERRMTPLVYIPGSGTVFWENSCASGSAAVGMVLAANGSAVIDVNLCQPGGILRVTSDPDTGETMLQGSVRFLISYPGS